MAGDPGSAVILAAMGYDVLSMNANNLLRVKSVLGSISLAECRELLDEVLEMESGTKVCRHIKQRLEGMGVESHFLNSQLFRV
jgi:phosphotransferase system enzyme I (PtsP)